jgi:hypothetical protein
MKVEPNLMMSDGKIPGSSRWRLPALGAEYLAIILLPVVPLLVSSDWFYPSSYNNVDSWIYYGYQRDLHRYVNDFQTRYFSDRLPWLLPVTVANEWLGPLAAHYVLKLSYLIVTLLAFYGLTKYATNPRAAYLTTIVFLCYPVTLNAAGWYYVDWPAVCYCVVGAFCLVSAARAGPWTFGPWGFTAGLLFGGAALCYPLIVVHLPAIALLFIAALCREGRWRRILRLFPTFLFVLVGAACTYFLCRLAWHALTGNWNYLGATRAYIASYDRTEVAKWLLPGWLWMIDAFWLVLPGAIAIGSFGVVVITATFKRVRKSLMETVLSMNALLVMALLVALRYFKGFPLLDHPHFAFILAPFVVMGLAPLLSTACSRTSTPVRFATVACCLILFTAPLARGVEKLFHPTAFAHWWVLSHLEGFGWLSIALCAGCVLAFCIIAIYPRSTLGMVSMLAVIWCVTTFGVTPFYAKRCHSEIGGRRGFLGVVDSARSIDGTLAGRNELICFAFDDPLYPHFISTFSCGLTVLRKSQIQTAPRLPDAVCDGLQGGDIIVVLSSAGREDVLAGTQEAIQKRGFQTKLVRREESLLRGARYALTFLEIVGKRGDPHGQQVRSMVDDALR